MLWNLFLAVIPLVLGTVLFRFWRRRSVAWWIGVCIFLAFLPNAPYVLSDAVHIVRWQNMNPTRSQWVLWLTGFGVFCLIGMEAYVLSIANVRHYLRREGLGRYTVPVILGLHAACAMGIYLGRVARFNSWDLAGNSHLVLAEVHRSLLRPWTLVLVGFTFVVTVTAAEVLQRVNLLAAARVARRRPER